MFPEQSSFRENQTDLPSDLTNSLARLNNGMFESWRWTIRSCELSNMTFYVLYVRNGLQQMGVIPSANTRPANTPKHGQEANSCFTSEQRLGNIS